LPQVDLSQALLENQSMIKKQMLDTILSRLESAKQVSPKAKRVQSSKLQKIAEV